jgi:hypothetical protein
MLIWTIFSKLPKSEAWMACSSFSLSCFDVGLVDGEAVVGLQACAFHIGACLMEPFGIPEISGHGLLHLLAGVHQPHDDKQGHQRGDKVGVSHLPGAAAAVGGFLSGTPEPGQIILHLAALLPGYPAAGWAAV